MSAHLIEFDSVHGKWRRNIRSEPDKVLIDGKTLGHTCEQDFSKVPWGDLGVDIVLEASGKFRTPEQLDAYFKAGVKKVIVATPSTMVNNGTQVKILAWYDSEWSNANRYAELARLTARSLV